MSMRDEWPPDIDKVAADIVAQAREPVSVPDCFIEWLRTYWMDNSEEEAKHHWRESARLAFWVCADYLRCLDAVLAKPPDDLVGLMQEHGWIMLYHRDANPWLLYRYDEYLAWLRDVRVVFERIVNEVIQDQER
jgi:hypothetical protein